MAAKTILVIGATGQQGGAVVRQLLTTGWNVRALVRDPHQPTPQSLQKLGVTIIQGDLDDPISVQSAMKDVYGVFSMQALDLHNLDKELSQGKLVVDSAKNAGVSHLVYSSVAGANRQTGITSFENKGVIEQYIRKLDIPFTILRPVMFMENFRFTLQKVDGQIQLAYKGALETKVQMIAVHDIGVFARITFENPNQYIGEVLEIAGDELTVNQLIEKFQRYFSMPVQYQASPPKSSHEHDGIKAFQFFMQEGYQADLAYLQQLHPTLLSLDTWLKESNISL
ncbi:Uncharacterized conserved protein YbjT, contains NAD(P)-binding and DUF2867 domains [Seinonella peptonophila]|uniref:Uncharacterized conserved protein YbjT, contains NAD(P)-binding and DUF2867 domains n=2 Tax=Seinonella peptonophila TaxID=112248 RepID=A0A1M4Z9G8_9BACL|nr:Uncharacterized conserved protein YbjT, contains NAD(P)-binding and DUF2867 domains [Seinonella peptonophila]